MDGLADRVARSRHVRRNRGIPGGRAVERRRRGFGFGAFQVMSCAALFVTEGGLTDGVSHGLDAVIGAVELASIAMVWLAFFPPALYRDWISGATTSATGATGES